MGLYILYLYSPIFVMSGYKHYDLGVPGLFNVLVGSEVRFAFGIVVVLFDVPVVEAVAFAAATVATSGCSSQWNGSKFVFGSTHVGFLQA